MEKLCLLYYDIAQLAQVVEHETLNLRVVGLSQTLGDLWLQGQALYFLTWQNVKPQLDNEGVLIMKWLFKHVQCFLIRDHFFEFQEPDQTSCRQLPIEIHRPLQSSWKNNKLAYHTTGLPFVTSSVLNSGQSSRGLPFLWLVSLLKKKPVL